MGLPDILTAITGTGGALVLAVVALAALLKGQWLVPAYIFEKERERVALLNSENANLNEAIKSLTEDNARLREDMAGLRVEVSSLRQDLARLQGGGEKNA